jgi:hypothetical protein
MSERDSRFSCRRVRVRSRTSCTSAAGAKLARIRPCARRSGNPNGVVRVALAPGHVAHLRRIGEKQREAGVQNVPDRFPNRRRSFHGDVGDPRVSASPNSFSLTRRIVRLVHSTG